MEAIKIINRLINGKTNRDYPVIKIEEIWSIQKNHPTNVY